MRPLRHKPTGMTLIELMTALAILAILTTLSYAGLTRIPRKARVNASVLELNAEIAAARSHAYGKDVRTALLINAGTGGAGPVRWWVVQDPWFTLDDQMAATTGWSTPADLDPPSPAPSDAVYGVIASGTFANGVGLFGTGFAGMRNSVKSPGCTATMTDSVSFSTGVTDATKLTGQGYFPPPYCAVPDDKGCTFCGSGTVVRGAVIFEPDGRIRLLEPNGTVSAAGAGSLAFTAPDVESVDRRAIAFTSSGLSRIFRPNE